MSDEVQQKKFLLVEKFETKVSFFTKKPFFALFILGAIGLIIRILFLEIETPMNSDNFRYFNVAISFVTDSSQQDFIYNDGWPRFLSLFFSIVPSNNFMHYMALQKLLSISISVLTIVPIYFFAKQFLKKQYAVLAGALFIFEPRIVQNSLFGITEPLYIISLVISLALIFNKKYYLQYVSFATISFAIIVRTEALFLLPVFFIIFFLHNRLNKKVVFHLFIISIILISILFPVSILRTEYLGNDGMTSRISGGVEHISETSNNNQIQIFSVISNGIINMLKFLTWSQIPVFVFFVPIGLILLIRTGNKYEKSLILVGISCLIPTIYAYSFASDVRWIFPLYPIFCIWSIYSIRYFLQKMSKPKSISAMIFLIILISSILFLNWKDIDHVREMELYNLALEISERSSMVNVYYPESSYLNVVGLSKMEKFPISPSKYLDKNIDQYWYNENESIVNIIKFGKKQGLTHLVIDNNENRPQFIQDILENEKNYPYLIKEFDSLENGYTYDLKLYKIDYDKFLLLNE